MGVNVTDRPHTAPPLPLPHTHTHMQSTKANLIHLTFPSRITYIHITSHTSLIHLNTVSLPHFPAHIIHIITLTCHLHTTSTLLHLSLPPSHTHPSASHTLSFALHCLASASYTFVTPFYTLSSSPKSLHGRWI